MVAGILASHPGFSPWISYGARCSWLASLICLEVDGLYLLLQSVARWLVRRWSE